jgi:ATP-dependent RNA helicase RhlE
LDLLGQKALTLAQVQMFVLDEADRMLDMGFLPDVRRIARHLPSRRQTLLFSATMPPEIRRVADELLHEPSVVSVHPPSSAAEAVAQRLYFVDRGDKQRLLIDLLRGDKSMRTLVFTRTKHGANRLTRQLVNARVDAVAIHGNKSQNARTRALDGFRSGKLRVLVATDVAARGIDVDGVTHVINYDLPNVPETYVHRIGRTGRAGRSGIAVSFCDAEERPHLAAIERLMGTSVPRMEGHAYPPKDPPLAAGRSPRTQGASSARGPQHPENARRQDGRGRRKGQRGSGGSGQAQRRPSAGRSGGSRTPAAS